MKEKYKRWAEQPIKQGYVVGAVVCVVLLISIFLLLGFRITYSPDLDNRWDVISAVSGWVGAVGSLAAVWVAIQIPNKIAEEQNKIALFEKRFEFMMMLENCVVFASHGKKAKTTRELQKYFLISMGNYGSLKLEEDLVYEMLSFQGRLVNGLQQGKYLFDFEVDAYALELAKKLQLVLSTSTDQKSLPSYFKQYQEAALKVQTLILPQIEAVLKLDK